jgi:succinoglycan biosynthesis protein ExoA
MKWTQQQQPFGASVPYSDRAVPFISIIVPVRNEEAFIEATLRQLLVQEYDGDKFEILVADGRSTDRTREIVAALQVHYPQLTLLDNPGQLSSAGRNVAIEASRGELLVLVDGHCEIDNPHYLAELADAFTRSNADCIGRPQPLDVIDATPLQRAIAVARSSRLGHHPASHIYSEREGFVAPDSVAIAYRREVFNDIGTFDESFDACEDVEFNHRLARAGLRCFFTPRVQVRYFPRSSLSGLFRQLWRYGRGRVRLLRKHPDTFSVPGFLPALFVAGVMAGPLLGLLFPVLLVPYFAVLGVYALTVFAFSFGGALRQGDLGLFPLLAAVFPTLHFGAGMGVLWEAIRPATVRERPSAHRSLRVAALPLSSKLEPLTKIAPAVQNALTIDVEDYFQVTGFDHIVDRAHWDDFEPRVADSTSRLLDVLAEANVRATFFILGWVAERQPLLLRRIQSAGHEIGCHSYAHRLIYTQTPSEFREDLRQARAAIEDAIGEQVRAYRAPSFSITTASAWALDVLIEEGFTIDSSIYPTHHDRYGIPGTPLEPHRIRRESGEIWEFPPPVCRIGSYPLPVGGGGYFRLYPYALTRRWLRKINAAGRPFAVYLHPWELDPEQPRLSPGMLRGFRHYVNLRRTEERLVRLLQDFTFGTLSESLTAWSGPREPVRRLAA